MNTPTTPPRVMRGASAIAAGAAGYVPTPAAGDQGKLLHGDGNWKSVTNASAATAAEAGLGTDTTKFLTPATGHLPSVPNFQMRALSDALFFGRGQIGSHAVWSSTEHGIIGTNDFTIAIPVVDWWYATSGDRTGLLVIADEPTGGYASTTASLTLAFETSGELRVAIRDPFPQQDANHRRYSIPKAAGYDLVGNRPGFLIVGRRAGALFVRLNTTGINLGPETVVGTPVSTWASAINSLFFRLGQIYGTANYLGKLGVPLVYTLGLSDAECDQLVTQGPRSLPYRHGSWKNYAPTSGTAGWSTSGGGFTLSQYDLATDPDGIGLPAGASTADYCVKVVRSGASPSQGVAFLSNLLRNGGPVWLGTANVKLASIVGGTNVLWSDSDGAQVAGLPPTGQVNSHPLTLVSVADGWKACTTTMVYVGSLTGSPGVGLSTGGANTDFVAYIHKPVARPLGLLFDGVVQPMPIIADAGPNRIGGRLVNRVDPITDKLSGTFVGQTSTNGNQQLYGGECVPLNAELEVWARSLSGTPTIDIGNVSGGAQVVSAAALTTAWKKLTLVGGSHVTTTRNLWVKSNTSDVVETRVVARIL